MRFFRILWLYCFLVYPATLLFGSSISGFVREDKTGEPLSYVNVFLKDTEMGTSTDQSGYYVITAVPPGRYTIIVSIIGYKVVKREIEVVPDRNLRMDFRLEVSPVAGERVTVTAERTKFKEEMKPSTIHLSGREIKVMPGFIEADVFRAVQLLPGVQSINDFSSALYVRGSTPDQNLIMLDGITVYNPFHLGGVFSTFNTDAIKEARFSAGGFPARHGGRMGSILNIINREGNTENYSGNVNISLISSKGLIEGPLPDWAGIKGSWMLAGRRTYFDTVTDILMYFVKLYDKRHGRYTDESDYIGFPYYFYDLEGKINLNLSNNHRLTLSSFYGNDILYMKYKDDYQYTYGSYTESYYDRGLFDWQWGNRVNSATWRWILTPTVIIRTFLAESRFRFWIDMDEKSQGEYIDEGDTTRWRDEYYFDVFDIVQDRTLETEVIWKPDQRHKVTGGVQHKQLNFNLGMIFEWGDLEDEQFILQSDTALWMEDKPSETSFYLQDTWQLPPRISVQPGLRFTYYNLHNRIYTDPRFGFKYMILDNLSFKLTFGKYHQFLSTANPEDENLRFIDIWLGIPADRKASSALHTIAGLEYLTRKDVLLRTEIYYKDFDHLITLKQGKMFSEIEDQIRFEPFNEFWDTKAYSYGAEFLIKKTRGNLRGWIGYSYSVTKKKTTVRDWFFPKYDRTHTLHVTGDWQWTKKLHIGMTISYATGNPYTPILAKYEKWYDSDWGLHPGWWELEGYLSGKRNSKRYPAYFRWDISLTNRKKVRFGFREWYLQIINVTNHLNILMYFYQTKYNWRTGVEGGVQRFGVPMFPFMPTFGYRLEF